MLDRSAAPRFKKIDKVDIPRINSLVSSNGIFIHSLNAGSQPVCKIEFLFHSGKRQENRPGVSFLTFKMLLEGTRNFTSLDIAEQIDLTGSFLGIEPGVDFSSLELYCLRSKVNELLPLLIEVIRFPTFPESEFKKQKQILKQNIAIELEKNNVLASRKFRELLFGSGHPHGYSLALDDIENIQLKDLVDFHSNVIMDSKFEILLSGNIDQILLDSLEKQIIPLSPPANKNILPDSKIVSQVQRKDLSKESSSQTSIRIGKIAIPKNHQDYNKLFITNEILGGYFGSRLMQNIREDKGLTYGIYSSLVPFVDGGYFVISADARKDLKEQVIQETFNEVSKLQNSLIDGDELSRVSNYLFGEFLSSVNTPFALMDKFKSIHLFGLDYNYYEEYFSMLRNIKQDEIQHMASDYLDKKEMIVVSVG